MDVPAIIEDIPELVDRRIMEMIDFRNASLSEGFPCMGPVDLVYIVKVNKNCKNVGGAKISNKGGVSRSYVIDMNGIRTHELNKREIVASYHFVLGYDCSSCSSIAAYINKLISGGVEGRRLSYGQKRGQFQIKKITYCCYNIFSECDIRVEAEFPGSVSSYCISKKGCIREVEDKEWREVYLSGILRFIHYADRSKSLEPSLFQRYPYYPFWGVSSYFGCFSEVVGLRTFSPFFDKDSIKSFFEVCEDLFYEGVKTGCPPEIVSGPDHVYNNLNFGICYVSRTFGTYKQGIELLSKFCEKNIGLNAFVFSLLLLDMRRLEAVSLLSKSICQVIEQRKEVDVKGFTYRIVPLLYAEISYTLNCGISSYSDMDSMLRSCLDLSKTLVHYVCGEFYAWNLLFHNLLLLKEYKSSLSVLNSAPILLDIEARASFLSEKRKIPEIDFIGLGLGFDKYVKDVFVNEKLREEFLLNGDGLRGHSAIAYQSLLLLHSAIGWEEMLRIRSSIFIMEDEEDKSDKRLYDEIELNGDDIFFEEESLDIKSLTSYHINSDTNAESLSTIGCGEQESIREIWVVNNTKNLCSVWLDNLFIIVYEELTILTAFKHDGFESTLNSKEILLLSHISQRFMLWDISINALEKLLMRWEDLGGEKKTRFYLFNVLQQLFVYFSSLSFDVDRKAYMSECGCQDSIRSDSLRSLDVSTSYRFHFHAIFILSLYLVYYERVACICKYGDYEEILYVLDCVENNSMLVLLPVTDEFFMHLTMIETLLYIIRKIGFKKVRWLFLFVFCHWFQIKLDSSFVARTERYQKYARELLRTFSGEDITEERNIKGVFNSEEFIRMSSMYSKYPQNHSDVKTDDGRIKPVERLFGLFGFLEDIRPMGIDY